jgi:hypothetical protein
VKPPVTTSEFSQNPYKQNVLLFEKNEQTFLKHKPYLNQQLTQQPHVDTAVIQTMPLKNGYPSHLNYLSA